LLPVTCSPIERMNDDGLVQDDAMSFGAAAAAATWPTAAAEARRTKGCQTAQAQS